MGMDRGDLFTPSPVPPSRKRVNICLFPLYATGYQASEFDLGYFCLNIDCSCEYPKVSKTINREERIQVFP